MDLRMPEMDGVARSPSWPGGSSGPGAGVDDLRHRQRRGPRVEAGATGYLLKDLAAGRAAAGRAGRGPGEAALSPSVATRLLGQVRAPAQEPLSQREFEVLEMAAGGATNREAAAKLFISEATVKTHLLHIYAKLGVSDRAAAGGLSGAPARARCAPGDRLACRGTWFRDRLRPTSGAEADAAVLGRGCSSAVTASVPRPSSRPPRNAWLMPQTSSALRSERVERAAEQLDLGDCGPGWLEAVRAEHGLGDGQGPLGAQPPGPQPGALVRAELAAARRGHPQRGLAGRSPCRPR